MKLSLNPQYGIRNESNCSYLIKIDRIDKRIDKRTFESIESVVLLPPLFGYILSQFIGNEEEETIAAISADLRISPEKIRFFVKKLTDNDHAFTMKLPSGNVIFPPFTLTANASLKKARLVTFQGFHPLDKFIVKRPAFPLFINLMITSKCRTDCIYCYADRSGKNDIDTETVLKTIDDAYREGVMYFNVSGGDIFSLKSWKIILKKLADYGFYPFISTKIPLKETDVLFLKDIGVGVIQFSIDSFLPDEIRRNIRRNGTYGEDVENTFRYLQKNKIRLGIRTVITKYNASLSSIKNTLNILECYQDILDTWDISPAFYSEFKGTYDNYQPLDQDIEDILTFSSTVQTDVHINRKDLIDKLNYKNIQYNNEAQFICRNKSCIANTYSMFIVSNGKATLCELMYYNNDFYTGDIRKNSLKEIWNSEMSLNLFNPKKEEILDTQENPCFSCSSFEKCKTKNGKSVCYVDIIRAYGPDKYQYPDPRCPNAPVHDKNLMLY